MDLTEIPNKAAMEIKFSKFDNIVSLSDFKKSRFQRNKHPKDQIERLAYIMRTHGVRQPIHVSNQTKEIVFGHGRLEAAKLNKWSEFPVVYQDFKSLDEEYACVQSDNAIAAWSDLDLSAINKDLEHLGPDFDIDLLGIKDFELEPADKYADKDADEVPEIKESFVKRGEIWKLGNHRLMCGDSTSIENVNALMDGAKVDMVFTDPPYNIAEKTKGVASGAPTNKQNAKLMASEWDKNFDFDSVSASIYCALAEDCTVYICTSSFVAPKIWAWMENSFDYSGYCVWSKPNPFPSLMKRRWAFSSELVCYATRGKQVFNYPSTGNALSVWTIPIGEGGLHPTQKPIKVSEHAIVHSSNERQSVLDLFGGSGSTLIACEKTNRKCFMMELDPHYCGVIIERWQQFTGQKAERLNGPSS